MLDSRDLLLSYASQRGEGKVALIHDVALNRRSLSREPNPKLPTFGLFKTNTGLRQD